MCSVASCEFGVSVYCYFKDAITLFTPSMYSLSFERGLLNFQNPFPFSKFDKTISISILFLCLLWTKFSSWDETKTKSILPFLLNRPNHVHRFRISCWFLLGSFKFNFSFKLSNTFWLWGFLCVCNYCNLKKYLEPN